MRKKKCIYCDTIYPEDVEKCPLCGGASADYITDPDEEAVLRSAEAPAEPETPQPERRAVSRPKPPVQPEDDDEEEFSGGQVPRWMTVMICAVLAAALIVGLAFAGYSLGLFGGGDQEEEVGGSLDLPFEDNEQQNGGNEQNDQQGGQSGNDQQTPPETTDPDEDDQTQTGGQTGTPSVPDDGDDEEEEDDPPVQNNAVSCKGISLNKTDVTLVRRGEQFTLSATLTPSNTTEEIVWSSTDESFAVVDEKGVVTAINGSGSGEVVARIVATCGSETAECLIRCNFANSEDSGTAEGGGGYSLSITDFTMSYADEEVTVSVENANLVSDTFSWSIDDPSIAEIIPAEDAVIVMARKSGTTTLRVKINDATELTCIVRCSATVGGSEETAETGDTGAETGDAEPDSDAETTE